jgi:hypothetical protein
MIPEMTASPPAHAAARRPPFHASLSLASRGHVPRGRPRPRPFTAPTERSITSAMASHPVPPASALRTPREVVLNRRPTPPAAALIHLDLIPRPPGLRLAPGDDIVPARQHLLKRHQHDWCDGRT